MENSFSNSISENLHTDIKSLVESGLLNQKVIPYLSKLDIDAEQLWILRFYNQYGILPTIKQSRQIHEAYLQNKLTLKRFYSIMETKLKPQKVIFAYQDFAPFFEEGISSTEIKERIIKILSNWQNNRTIHT